jgi:hypothetical protein
MVSPVLPAKHCGGYHDVFWHAMTDGLSYGIKANTAVVADRFRFGGEFGAFSGLAVALSN